VAVALARQRAMGDAGELVVEQRQELIESASVASPPG
jgi:hypothetical protein